MANYGPNRPPSMTITIHYDCRGARKSKSFSDPYEARRFYKSKFIAGKNPELKAQKD